jgi:PAS domain S-box-containing protein
MTPSAPKILIVDDQPRNLDALEAMLLPLNCEIIRATTADEALLTLLRHQFAAIVLDIRMPGMSGFELAKLIKQRKRSRDVPILFLTAHLADETDVLEGYGVGAVDYLSKPINQEILRSKIGVFIDLFTKTQALARLNDALHLEITEREHAQEQLRAANLDLERRVQERTAALTRAHQGVRENEERLSMALAVAGIAAWEADLLTGHVTWSADPEKLFRLPAGTLGPEQRLAKIAHADDKSLLDESVARALKDGDYAVEYRLLRPDGSIVWITERGRVVKDSEGASHRIVGISRNVTDDKTVQLERERLLSDARQARDEVQRQSVLKDEFLASLSHELRTPMNVILGWLSTLEEGKPIKDVYSALAIVKRNAELQAKLIDDLLDMNKLISGTIQLEVSNVEIGALLQTTLQGLQPVAEVKGIQLLASLDASLAVMGDARRLQQVFWNVLHNAIKFTPRGGRVEIRTRQNDLTVHIAVQDSGKGISAAFLPHVFDRFRQEDAGATGGTAGLGIGLSIARQFVELHGGQIAVVSAGPGMGSTFAIELPSAKAASQSGVA